MEKRLKPVRSVQTGTRLTHDEGVFDALMKTPVCVCSPNVMGLDGTTYAMEIIRGFNRVQ